MAADHLCCAQVSLTHVPNIDFYDHKRGVMLVTVAQSASAQCQVLAGHDERLDTGGVPVPQLRGVKPSFIVDWAQAHDLLSREPSWPLSTRLIGILQVADVLEDRRFSQWMQVLQDHVRSLLHRDTINDSTPKHQAAMLSQSLLTFRAAFLAAPASLRHTIFDWATHAPSTDHGPLTPELLRSMIAARNGDLLLDIGPLPNPDTPDVPLLPLNALHEAVTSDHGGCPLRALTLIDERFRSIFNPDGGAAADTWLPHFLGISGAQPHLLSRECNTHVLAGVLRAAPMLRELSLHSVGATSTTFFTLAHIAPGLPLLHTLRLSSCLDSMHALAGLHAVTRGATTLRVLELTWDRHSRGVGDFFRSRAFALRAAIAAATALTSLSLSGCNLFLDRTVHMPALQSLRLDLRYHFAQLRADGHQNPGVALLWGISAPQLTRLSLRIGTTGAAEDLMLRNLPQADRDALWRQSLEHSTQAAIESALFPPHGPLLCLQEYPQLRVLETKPPAAHNAPMGRLAWLRLLFAIRDAAAKDLCVEDVKALHALLMAGGAPT
eukprot:jgi/Ulvmu1/1610/UM111_0039.1